MKWLVICLMALCAINSAASETIIEFAAGAGAPHWITSDKWRGSVGNNGLYYKEYGLRASKRIQERIKISTIIGWLNEREFISLIHSDVIGATGYRRNRETAYLIPSAALNAGPFTLDIGGIFYKSNDNIDSKGSPFDRYHGVKPSIGLEFGDDDAFLSVNISDAFPLYSGGGGTSISLGRRWYGYYEHRISFYSGIFNSIGLGYGGEFNIYKKSALCIGFMLGGNNDKDDIYSFRLGIKTILPHR